MYTYIYVICIQPRGTKNTPTFMCSSSSRVEVGCPDANDHDGRKADEKEGEVDNPQSAAHLQSVVRSISALPEQGGSESGTNHIVPHYMLM